MSLNNRGLRIDDDEVKEKYQHQGLQANRKRGNMEKDLDSMLFGGGPAPARRKPKEETAQKSPQTKPANQQKSPSVDNKPSIMMTTVTNVITTSTTSPITQKQTNQTNQTNYTSQTVTSTLVNKSAEIKKQTISPVKPNVNKSNQKINTAQYVTPSILPNQNIPSVRNLQIESKANITQIQSQNKKKPGQKLKAEKIEEETHEQKKKENVKPVIEQPKKHEEVFVDQEIHLIGNKISYNRPSHVRKLKKIAEDFKFAEENPLHHTAINVVRPFETDRSRQKKRNDFDFEDSEFPSASISLGLSHAGQKSIWKKPNEITKVVSFGKYVDPNDIRPGKFSSPFFLSSLSAIAELQVNTKRLIEDQKFSANGFYLIRLFINSVWRYVVVDSKLPYFQGENAGAISYEDSEFELSQALIEKAYAKSFGGYDVFSKHQSRDIYLRDLTGAPTARYAIDNPDLGAIIKKAIANNQVILAVPNEKISSMGLNANYSLNLINLTNKGSMELRNSWGTTEERTKINFSKEGTFELNANLVRQNISHVLIAHINNAYHTTTIQSKQRFGFYTSYNFKVRNDTHGYFTASQIDERLFPSHQGYAYSPFRVIIQKINSDNTATFINAGFSEHSRNLDLEVNLTPGQYTVFVVGHWKAKQYDFYLSFYGAESLHFERIHTEKLPNLIAQSLEALNLENGRKSSVGNKNQYILYDNLTNLLIVTAENTSEREAVLSQDFSRIDFKHLALLTAKDNEENYANKIIYEVEEYKTNAIENRRWSVQVGPKEKFTWVISTDLPYSESNLKQWGFK